MKVAQMMSMGGVGPVSKEEALAALASVWCACGKRKGHGKAFCYECFKGLGGGLAPALYKRVGEGFEQAYAEGLAWVRRFNCGGVGA